jgi:hypothetical protein
MNIPACWRSKAQRGVTLSIIEAEYIAISEAVYLIKFIYCLLQGIRINVELPIVAKTDNIGAIFMAQNSFSGVRTCHVDTTSVIMWKMESSKSNLSSPWKMIPIFLQKASRKRFMRNMWRIVLSDWAGKLESRIIIVKGFIMYLLGVPICWRSKAQKEPTLSSHEAKYVAMLEAVKTIWLIFYMLRSMSIAVHYATD